MDPPPDDADTGRRRRHSSNPRAADPPEGAAVVEIFDTALGPKRPRSKSLLLLLRASRKCFRAKLFFAIAYAIGVINMFISAGMTAKNWSAMKSASLEDASMLARGSRGIHSSRFGANECLRPRKNIFRRDLRKDIPRPCKCVVYHLLHAPHLCTQTSVTTVQCICIGTKLQLPHSY